MRTAAMNRYYAVKTEAVKDLKILQRDKFIELAEIEREIAGAKQGLLELAEIDREIPKPGDSTELAEIDRKIVAAIIMKDSDTQIELASGEVSSGNSTTLVGLGYLVVRLNCGMTIISWKPVEAATAS